jgi:regulatory factor X, other
MASRIAQRPDSRASTTSAASQNDNGKETLSQGAFMTGGPEAALLHYHAALDNAPQFDMSQHPHVGHVHSQSASFAMPSGFAPQDTTFMPQDMQYPGHVRVGSVPVTEGGDEKRRKGAAVTATNDKELREMLARNEGRPLKAVAQEVIQKERTPMAEKTKQLFAMLW